MRDGNGAFCFRECSVMVEAVVVVVGAHHLLTHVEM